MAHPPVWRGRRGISRALRCELPRSQVHLVFAGGLLETPDHPERCAFWRLAESLGARCCRRRDAALVATRPRHVRAMSTAGAQCHRKWDATFITHVVAGEKRSGSVERAVKEGVHAVSKAPAVAPSAHLGSSLPLSAHLGSSRPLSAHLGASRRISAHLVHAASKEWQQPTGIHGEVLQPMPPCSGVATPRGAAVVQAARGARHSAGRASRHHLT